jgi:hypothetical protein
MKIQTKKTKPKQNKQPQPALGIPVDFCLGDISEAPYVTRRVSFLPRPGDWIDPEFVDNPSKEYLHFYRVITVMHSVGGRATVYLTPEHREEFFEEV